MYTYSDQIGEQSMTDLQSIVLNEKEVALVNSATNYAAEIQTFCNNLVTTTQTKCNQALAETRQKIHELEQKNIEDYKRSVEQASLELQAQNYAVLKEFMEAFEHDTLKICGKIIDKLGMTAVPTAQISTLIKDELTIYLKSHEVKITTNADGVHYLKQCLVLPDIAIKYIENETYADGVCRINDGMSIISVDLQSAADKIHQIFTPSSATTLE